MRVLDLFSGRGGWSRAFSDRGHNVVTVDINNKFKPTIVSNINNLEVMKLGKFDIILASPPCTEFAKYAMPDSWYPNKPESPDLTLVLKTIEIVKILKPKFYIIENVRGAIKFFMPILGKHKKRVGSFYLWGDFPVFYCRHIYKNHSKLGKKNRAEIRSEIPYDISMAVCRAVETFLDHPQRDF